MTRFILYLCGCWFLLFFLPNHSLKAEIISPGLQSVLQVCGSADEIDVIITLADKVDFKFTKETNTRRRRARIIKALKQKAVLNQRSLKDFFKKHSFSKPIRSLWIHNGLAVNLRADVIRKLANWPGIERIRLDAVIKAPHYTLPCNAKVPRTTVSSSAEPGWNIDAIDAPALWNLGHSGEGLVIASMDTGVDGNHPDLVNKWRGGNNSWFDPNGEHATPYDNDGHGTAVMGIMVGGTVGGSAIGVAPDAKWIAVKIFDDQGAANLSSIHEGFQWLLDPDGNSDTDDAPDVVNNSWGFENDRDECLEDFQDDIQVLRAAGIAVVFAAGNSGPERLSSISPANNPGAFAVAALDETFTLDWDSSRGPSTCDGDIFPEILAPGVYVWTSDLSLFEVPYVYVTGSSFAAPHVAGAMALLMDAFPELTVSEMETVLKQSALDLGPEGPDNDYGHGLINLRAAYRLLLPAPRTLPWIHLILLGD